MSQSQPMSNVLVLLLLLCLGRSLLFARTPEPGGLHTDCTLSPCIFVTNLARDEAALRLVSSLQGHDLLLVREVVDIVRVGLELGVRESSRLDAPDHLQLSVGQSYLVGRVGG